MEELAWTLISMTSWNQPPRRTLVGSAQRAKAWRGATTTPQARRTVPDREGDSMSERLYPPLTNLQRDILTAVRRAAKLSRFEITARVGADQREVNNAISGLVVSGYLCAVTQDEFIIGEHPSSPDPDSNCPICGMELNEGACPKCGQTV